MSLFVSTFLLGTHACSMFSKDSLVSQARTTRAGSGVSGRRVFPDIFFSRDISMAIMRLNYVKCNKNV